MTLPMPGPHQHDDGWHYGCTTRSGLWDRGDEAQRLDKHLTDAECAAEYWRAGWIADHDFHDEHEADEASTWHRFATHPHAFKENP